MFNLFLLRILGLVLISLAFFMTSCDTGVSYTPPFGLVSLRVGTDGISVEASSPKWVTSIGTFSVDLSTKLSDTSNQQTPDNGLLLTIRYYNQEILTDAVYQLNTGRSKVAVTADGHITFSIEQKRVFIDASESKIQEIEIRNVDPPLDNTYLGSLNFQDYCRSIGHIRASLDQINAYGWACVTVSGDHVGINTDAACQQQYKQPNVLSRMVNYSDPKDWHCYSHVKGLGSINFPQYCQSLGQGASLDGKTAYDWHCVTSGSHVFIDTDAACRWQYNESDAFSSIRNYFSPNGWMCLGKA